MITTLKNMMGNATVELLLRWLLGIVFISASFHKIIDPGEFAKIIYGYKLFPSEIINFFAILIPFIELTCGVALVAGVWPRSAAIIVNMMLFAFIIAISINLIRGHEFDCGCFSFGNEKQKTTPIGLLIRDILWFCIGLFLIMFKNKRKLSFLG